jgi:hypothetical protein
MAGDQVNAMCNQESPQHAIEEVQLLTSIIIHFIEELRNQSRFPAPRMGPSLSEQL